MCVCLAGGVWAGRRARLCLHKGHWAAWVQRLPGKARAREADDCYGQVGEDSAVQAEGRQSQPLSFLTSPNNEMKVDIAF